MSAESKGRCVVNSPRFHKGSTGATARKILAWPNSPREDAKQKHGWAGILPGMVAGASDVDPTLVLTATIAGAAFGYSLLWAVLLCIPFLLAVFAVSSRIGFETRQGLVDLLRAKYGRNIALAFAGLIVLINMAMIVADLMAVTDAFSIITQLPRMFFIAAIGFLVWWILIFRDYRKITNALVLLSLPLFIYVAAAILAHPNWSHVFLSSVLPRIPRGSYYPETLLAIFGALLTPYVLVWQTSSHRDSALAGGLVPGAGEHRAGTVVSTVLCFAIMVAAGTVLRLTPGTDLTTRMAGSALAPAVGSLGPILFAVGIIGAGLVALPVLIASMCYSVAEAMGWRSGLHENPWEAKPFYVLISSATFVAAALNFIRINPVTVLYWSQVLAGVLTLPILLLVLVISNDKRVMRTTNTWGQNFWIGAASGAVICAGLVVLWWKLIG
jgi:Mn2+/Fe2+ NRAMP family transporter